VNTGLALAGIDAACHGCVPKVDTGIHQAPRASG
jgi:hypothetical protein